MSTSYYVHCVTCNIAVTDRNACDNAPEIPHCIVDNIISYAHLAMFLEELPIPKNAWSEYEVKVRGHRLDLADIRKHCTHELIVKNEYGGIVSKDGNTYCGASHADMKCALFEFHKGRHRTGGGTYFG